MSGAILGIPTAPPIGAVAVWDGTKFEPRGLTSADVAGSGGSTGYATEEILYSDNTGTLAQVSRHKMRSANAGICTTGLATNVAFRVGDDAASVLIGTTQIGQDTPFNPSSGATTKAVAQSAYVRSAGTGGTFAFLADFYAVAPGGFGADVITRAAGYAVEKITAGTNNFGYLYSATPASVSATGTFCFYNDTTDPSYFGGAVTFNAAVKTSVTALTDASTIATDASLGNVFSVTIAGNRTMGAPSNPPSGALAQTITYRIKQDATGSRTMAWNAVFRFSVSNPTPTMTTTASLTDYVSFQWNNADSKWDCIGYSLGYT